ncbi:MAG: TRAP transporter small permease subunit [Gammaproteobacteria bacterium]|nr:TRAP transporter small permease subunit [Gammaproteobacteria bacterium]
MNKNRLHRANHFLRSIRNSCTFVASCSLVVLITIFAWLVFGRYVLNDTPTWVEQLALVLICYITFLGAASGVYDRTHLGVDFLREMLPNPLRHILRLLADLMVCIFGIYMAVSAAELVSFGWDTKLPMLGVPEGVRTFPMAVCGALISLFAGFHFFSTLAAGPTERPTEPKGL